MAIKMKLKAKMVSGYLIISAIAVFIGLFGLYQMNQSYFFERLAEKLITFHNKMTEMKLAHVLWRLDAGKFQRDVNMTSLPVEKNPHLCKFGQWLAGEERKEMEKLVPGLEQRLKESESIHEVFHQAAENIENLLKAGNRESALAFLATEITQ